MISRLYTFLFLAFFGSFILLSCNGREKAMVTPQESLKQKKLLDSFSENIKYFPEDYAEVETDTMLSNGFSVNIKTFTDMKSSVLNEFEQDTIIYKHYYRDNMVNVQVSKDDELIFEQKFDKNYFISNYPEYKDYFTEANLIGFWLNENHIDENSILLKIAFNIPETDIYLDYDLLIDKEGNYSITEDKEEEII